MGIAAIFDMDDTLLADSSGRMLFQYLRQEGLLARYFKWHHLPPFLVNFWLYRLGLADATLLLARMARISAGLAAAELWEISQRWFDQMVVHTITAAGREQLEWHRSQGHRLLICSGSSQFAVTLVARHLQIEDAIYTEWLVEDGRLTGKLRQPVVYGAGKVYWAQRWAAAQAVDLAGSYFYSDDVSDLPLLELVAHPTAVNPTPRLARLAQQKGWPIEAWH